MSPLVYREGSALVGFGSVFRGQKREPPGLHPGRGRSGSLGTLGTLGVMGIRRWFLTLGLLEMPGPGNE